jgi:Spy/CpxP family protein refolding chaperone
VLALAAGAQAQEGGELLRGPTVWMLLGEESVQKELKLTLKQIEKTKASFDKQRGMLRELHDIQDKQEQAKKFEELRKEVGKLTAEFLKPDQVKRLKQITLQHLGFRAFGNPEVARELSLTEKQKGKVKEILDDRLNQATEILKRGEAFSEESRKKVRELLSAETEKIMNLLTADQKAKWKEMAGEPFKGEIRSHFVPPSSGQRQPQEKK